MYQGNLYEFIDKLNTYCVETFGMSCRLATTRYKGKYTLIMSRGGWGFHYDVCDDKDFEEQCFKAINWALDY